MTAERVSELRLLAPVRPKGQGRPRFDPRSKRAYTPPATRAYVACLRALAEQAWGGREPLRGPVALAVSAEFALPKRAGARPHHVQRPDVDNLAKAAADALNGLVFVDDAQIVDLRARKNWSVVGNAVLIEVWSLQ